jgi:hypothetical protein
MSLHRLLIARGAENSVQCVSCRVSYYILQLLPDSSSSAELSQGLAVAKQ